MYVGAVLIQLLYAALIIAAWENGGFYAVAMIGLLSSVYVMFRRLLDQSGDI